MGFVPEQIVAQVLERSDIVQTISNYVPLKKAGRNFKTNCPFHNEKTPSFVVNPDKQIFHCFGCSEGGNVITFVMKQEHLSFPEAIRLLADKVGIMIPTGEADEQDQTRKKNFRQSLYHVNEAACQFYHNILLSDKDSNAQKAQEYLKARGVSLPIVQQFKLGFALDRWDALMSHLRKSGINLKLMEKAGLIIPRDKQDGYYDRFRNRITFPIFDIKSQCLGFGARAMDDGVAKYINSPETPIYSKGRNLYGLNFSREAIKKKGHALIVEGYLDFLIP
jgi:DNA primase